MEIRELAFLIIAILFAVFILKIFFWLLPVIIGLLIGFFIYMFFKKFN